MKDIGHSYAFVTSIEKIEMKNTKNALQLRMFEIHISSYRFIPDIGNSYHDVVNTDVMKTLMTLVRTLL